MTTETRSLASRIVDYEDGVLDNTQVVQLIQDLVDNGMAWQLRGHYGRLAHDLIKSGHVTAPTKEDA